MQDDARGNIDLTGCTNTDGGDGGRWLIGSDEELFDRFLDGRKDGTRATRNRGCAPLAGYDRVVVGDEQCLDLCRTKIDAHA